MTLSNGKTSAYQWDIGLTVPTTDAEGTIRRFTNEHSARSIPVACAEDGDGNMVYAIPNILLTTGRPIIMFTLAGDNDGIIYTDTQEYLPVYPAPKPDDYIYTEAEINLWKSLCDRMDTAESNIATNTENIGTNAGNIASNTLAIGQNTLDIAANALAIGANTSDINAIKAAPHVHVFDTYESGDLWYSDEDFDDLVAAFHRGDHIYCYGPSGLVMPMVVAEYSDDDAVVVFGVPLQASANNEYGPSNGWLIAEYANGAWTISFEQDMIPQWLDTDGVTPGYVPTMTADGVEWQAPQGGGSGLTDDAKDAILQIARKVAYIDANGLSYYNELYDALYSLSSISATYTQGGTVYDTDSLDSLKADLVVTGTFGDGGTSTIPSTDYTLSGTLTAGTSTITVTYEGKTTTFTVTVTHVKVLVSISAVYTQGGTVYDTDSLDSLKSDLVVTAIYDDTTTATIASTDYTLSGTLTAGTSTITATYDGKTDTFTVSVTHVPVLSSISAVYTQSSTVYPTDTLASLKTDLVVTAHYDDSSTATVPGTDYTLSGTLTVGTSTITVSYSGKTTTFTVTVTATPAVLVSISAVYTQSGTVYNTDSLDSLKADLVVTATYDDSSTATVPSTDYTLSGTLTVGTSTITVTYGGETDTFSVTVTEADPWSLVYDLGDSDMIVTGMTATSYQSATGGYYTAGDTRITYPDFDLLIQQNKIFKVEVSPDLKVGIQKMTTGTATAVANHNTISYTDSGWQSSGYEFINSYFQYPTATYESIRPVLAKQDQTQTISLDDFDYFKLYEQTPQGLDNSAWLTGYIASTGKREATSTNGERITGLLIPVIAGHTYRFANSNPEWSTNWAGWLFVSSDLSSKSARSTISSSVDHIDITVPSGYSWLAFSSRNMADYYSTATLTDITT